MKRLLILFLAMLLLCGCDGQEITPTQTVSPTTLVPTQPAQPGLYLPGSAAEEQSFGAIRAYELGSARVLAIHPMGKNLAVLTCDEGDADAVTVRVLTGEDCAVLHTARLEAPVQGLAYALNEKGLAYCNPQTHEIVILDSKFSEKERVDLPEDIIGSVAISHDLRTAYYCLPGEIRALELDSGISRLVRQQEGAEQSLLGTYFNDSVLLCRVTADGETYVGFVRGDTGELLDTDTALEQLTTQGDSYFLVRTEGVVQEYIFGDRTSTPQSLFPVASSGGVFPLLDDRSVLVASGSEGKPSVEIYDLTSGKRVSSRWVRDLQSVACAASFDGSVWFAGLDVNLQTCLLYRWDTSMSRVSNDTVYTSRRYTEDAPDEAGLSECRTRADGLEKQYGVAIHLRGVTRPEDYDLTEEYQPEAFQMGLDTLETVLAQFPEGFFKTAAQVTKSGKLNINLVRGISHGKQSIQYWADGDAFMALSIGETTQQSFYHELFHMLDTYIHSYSTKLDTWEKLNPRKFSYDNNYDDYLTRESTKYLEGENRAFIDSYSMTYPMEDRATIFSYAMMPGNEDCFDSKTMQKKLERLCEAIRDAYGWKKDSRAFPWEQYLHDPLAKTK